MVTRSRNARGLRTPYGPDVRLPKIVTFRRGDAAARAVIGPLTKTQCRTIKVHDYVEASAWSLCFVRTIKSPLEFVFKCLFYYLLHSA